jgi:hypothetical protein
MRNGNRSRDYGSSSRSGCTITSTLSPSIQANKVFLSEMSSDQILGATTNATDEDCRSIKQH